MSGPWISQMWRVVRDLADETEPAGDTVYLTDEQRAEKVHTIIAALVAIEQQPGFRGQGWGYVQIEIRRALEVKEST